MLYLRPLESAEENVRRLAQDQSINLPFQEYCPTIPILNHFTKCPNCDTRYCSETCRLESFQKYHAALCLPQNINNIDHPLNILNEVWKSMHYPPETGSITLIVRILAMIKQCNDLNSIHAVLNDFQSIGVNHNLMIFHKLLGENFANNINKLYELTKIAFPDEILEPVSFLLTVDIYK